MSGGFIIDSRDIGEAEELLTATYTRVRLNDHSRCAPTRTRVWRTQVGPLNVDDFQYSYDLHYEAEPADFILLCRMLKGAIEDRVPGQPPRTFKSGECVALGAQEGTPYAGFIQRANFTLITIPRHLLSEVAGGSCGRGDEAVQLTSPAPISAEANRHLVDVIDHIRHGVINSPAAEDPLVAASMARYLAATVLRAFPHTAVSAQPSAYSLQTLQPQPM